MNTESLYGISQTYLALLNSADEYTDEIAAQLEAVEGTLIEKAGNVAGYIQHVEDQVAVLKAREQSVAEYRRVLENKVARLKDYLRVNMDLCGIHKIEWGTHRITLVNNPPKVVVADEALVPPEYKRVVETVSIDKKAIAEVLKSGGGVEGCRLEQGVSVRIK